MDLDLDAPGDGSIFVNSGFDNKMDWQKKCLKEKRKKRLKNVVS